MINKIFLPFQKKGKKHHPSSRKCVHLLRRKRLMQGEKHPILFPMSFFSLKAELRFPVSARNREKNQVNPDNPVRYSFSYLPLPSNQF
jgi:hypothetical protein